MTTDPYVTRIIRANRIFVLTGHPIWPWEVDDIPDEWHDAFRAFSVEVGEKAAKIPKPKGK